MELILVRHGDAHAGLHGIIAGPRGCRGLTDLGRAQAARLRDHLAEGPEPLPDVMVSSELPRAIETAAIVAEATSVDSIPRNCDLCEVHTGDADGMDWADYSATFGSLDMVAEPDREFAPGGDSWTSFHQRVGRAMHQLATEHADQRVMAVCHAGVIAAAMRILLGIPETGASARLLPTNTGLTQWSFDPTTDQWTLRRYNDATHLNIEA